MKSTKHPYRQNIQYPEDGRGRRNVYLNNNRDIGRKLREMILAMAMETKFSKEQILELYLNKVYFGGGAYGVDAASRRFFDHGAEDITLAEATIIAGLVKAPSRYSPTADAKAAIGRAGVVLEVMQVLYLQQIALQRF